MDDPNERRTTLAVVAALLASVLAVLLVTGVWLTFHYRPLADERLRDAHRIAAVLTVPLVLFLVALTLRRRPSRPVVAAAAVLVLASGAALLGGARLPWETLGLWMVTVGNEYRGVLKPLDDSLVRFVVVDEAPMSTGAYRVWVVAHLFVVPVALLASGGFLVRRFLLRR